MDLWLSGVYDIHTFKFLKENEVKKFTFDFRALSLTFIQEYKLHEILVNEGHSSHQYQLLFQNEKDFVIDKIVTDVKSKLIEPKSLSIELQDHPSSLDFNQFKTPYYWHFDISANYHKIINSDLCKGIILHSKTIEELSASSDFHHFATDLLKVMNEKEMVVYLDEDGEIPKSFFDFYRVNSIILPISSKLENSYRNINTSLLEKRLNLMKRATI